jgi:hypothetical protein
VLIEVHDQVSRSSRPRYVLEMAVARIVHTRPSQPISALVNRLVDLERRLRTAGAQPRAREPVPEGERRRLH